MPAQQVVITEQLDPNLDWRTFRLTSFGFGGLFFAIPANSAYYQTTIDLTATLGFDVAFTATIDVVTGIATWILTTIDPKTGAIPSDPTVGILPPNNSAGIGEGFAGYTIEAPASDKTGTEIDAKATITFDTEPPLNTPKIFDFVDAGTSLSSTVTTLVAYENSTTFVVGWAGSDASSGSGVGTFTIYVSDNGGPYTPWLVDTTLSSAPYTGQDGHTYSFASLAIDNTGNFVLTPLAAEASTLVDITPPTSTVTALSLYSSTDFTVNWSGSDGASGSGVASYDIYVSDNGATATLWQSAITATSATFDGQDGHTYAFYSVATDNAGNVEATPSSPEATTTAGSVPSISTQPSTQTIVAGATVTFTAVAAGSPSPTVQWQLSTDGGTTFNDIAGATSTTLSFTTDLTMDGYKYQAVFTNVLGTMTTTIATLTVQYAPQLGTSPGDQTITAGQSVTFTVAASGDPAPTVQWQLSTDGGAHFANISGATSVTLTFTTASTMDGYEYQAVFTNSIGTATTSIATLTVQYAPQITTQPATQTVTAGQTVALSVAVLGDPIPTVQWQLSTDGGSTFTNISGATGTTLSFTSASTQNQYKYRAILTNSLGTVTTSIATLTVQLRRRSRRRRRIRRSLPDKVSPSPRRRMPIQRQRCSGR